MIRLFAMIAVTLTASVPAAAQPYPTIVGEWFMEETGPEDCGTQFGVQIGAMSYVEETYICSFDNVRRDGWQVTWNGSCSDGNASEKTRVVAIEDGGRLSVWFNGRPAWSTLRRCGADTSAMLPMAERVPLRYATYGGDSEYAHRYWANTIDLMIQAGDDPVDDLNIYVAEAGGYEFVSAESSATCGIGWECPIKIVKAGLEVGYFNACAERDVHALAADGSRFYACEDSGQGRPMTELMHR